MKTHYQFERPLVNLEHAIKDSLEDGVDMTVALVGFSALTWAAHARLGAILLKQ